MSQLKPIIGISASDYEHPLYDLHKEKKIGRYEVIKVKIPKGTRQRFFLKGLGVTQCEHIDNYPIVKLIKRSGLGTKHNDYSDNCFMTDTPYEIETNKPAIKKANGDVLELGLGIGYFTYHASQKDNVRSITIVEKQKEIINLVYPVIKNKKTRLVHEDAERFMKKTKKKFNMINIDFVAGMLPFDEMEKLKKLAQKILKPDGVVVMWQEDLWKMVKDNIKKGKRESNGIGIFDPCVTCGKTIRHDYSGLCMDCADELGISELGYKI